MAVPNVKRSRNRRERFTTITLCGQEQTYAAATFGSPELYDAFNG